MNPERPWPQIDDLAKVTADAGFVLRERLTAHPEYLREPWLDPRLISHVEALVDPETGLADEAAYRSACRGRSRMAAGTASGGPICTPRSTPRDVVPRLARTSTRRTATGTYCARTWRRAEAGPRRAPERIDADVKAALAAAERDPAGLSDAQALTLMTATGPALDAAGADRG